MTPQELVACTGARIDRAQTFLPFIEDAMHEFQINTDQRRAAFLAQIGHESGAGTIGRGATGGQGGFDRAVAVPALALVEHLHVAHAALDEPARSSPDEPYRITVPEPELVQ